MKKFIYIFIAATILSCTKSEVAYEPTHEIGFTAAAGNITKAADGTSYPTSLNMYVYAWSVGYGQKAPDYLDGYEFAYKTVEGISKPVWGGKNEQYCWPSSYNLHFAGYSKSGNMNTDNPDTGSFEGGYAEFDCTTDILSINNYSPVPHFNTDRDFEPASNDLMWFPSTKYTEAAGYGKNTESVPVTMYHTCSWLTFLIKGDKTTAGKYTVTRMWMSEIDLTADVTCGPDPTSTDPKIDWTNNNQKTAASGTIDPTTFNILLENTAADDITLTEEAVDVDTVQAEYGSESYGSIIVIPQVPGKINLEYTYTSAGTLKTETKQNIDLKINNSSETNFWQPGKHYIYTITIKANEIVIAPTPALWTSGNSNVTVE